MMVGNLLKRLYAWACEHLYAELAAGYDQVSWLISLGLWDRWRALALDYVQGTRVLEIGFGTGALLPHLAEQAALTVGLELSPTMQQQTTQKLMRKKLRLPRVQARAQAMPFADGVFDTLITTFPAPYIVEAATLHECARLLRHPINVSPGTNSPGGRLVIVGLWVALDGTMWSRLAPLFYGRPSVVWLDHLTAQLLAAGFYPRISEHAVSWARVGVVVAERIEAAS